MLTGPQIKHEIESPNGRLRIRPFEEKNINPCSINLTLGNEIMAYEGGITFIDPRRDNSLVKWVIPEEGILIFPGKLYLATTVEWLELHGVVGQLVGRSSFGRLGLGVEVTSGFIDDGFCGQITLELWSLQPILLRPGDRVCQIAFEELQGERMPYRGRYQGQRGPTASRIYLGEM